MITRLLLLLRDLQESECSRTEAWKQIHKIASLARAQQSKTEILATPASISCATPRIVT